MRVSRSGACAAGLLPPGVEVPGGGHVLGNPLVVEVEQDGVVGHQAAPSGLVLQVPGLFEEPLVAVEELMVGLPVALHQGMGDEQLPCRHRVHPRVADLAGRHDRQAVQRDLLLRHGRTAARAPVRLAVAALGQVLGQLLGPFRFDTSGRPGPQPRGFDEFGGDHPRGRLPGQHGIREDREPGTPCPGELGRAAPLPARPGFCVQHPDVREQAGQQGHVHPVRQLRRVARPGLRFAGARPGLRLAGACPGLAGLRSAAISAG